MVVGRFMGTAGKLALEGETHSRRLTQERQRNDRRRRRTGAVAGQAMYIFHLAAGMLR